MAANLQSRRVRTHNKTGGRLARQRNETRIRRKQRTDLLPWTATGVAMLRVVADPSPTVQQRKRGGNLGERCGFQEEYSLSYLRQLPTDYWVIK